MQKGQSLIEILIVVGITAIFLPTLILGLTTSRGGKAQQSLRMQATAYLKEGVEAVRSVREGSWDSVGNLNPSFDYHPVLSGTTWSLQLNSEPLDTVFTRTVNLENVYRDTSGNITLNTSPPNIIDPSVKRLIITVSWENPLPSEVKSALYLSRYLNNQTFVDTTQVDFNGGIQSNTFTTITAGGEVRLTYLGGGLTAGPDWCQPGTNTVAQLDLTGTGAANAITAIVGQSFIGTGQNNSGPAMVRVTGLSANPPVPVQNGSFDGGYKTNDIFGETGFAYIATDTNAKEVVIINTTSFTEVGNFNATGTSNGISVFVSTVGTNKVGFILSGTNLSTFNISAAPVSKPELTVVPLGGTGASVYVVGNYAYVAMNATSNQLRIFEITNNGATITPRGTFTPPAPVAGVGRDVYVSPDGTRAYLVTAVSASRPEFWIINTTNKLAPALVSATSSYDTTGMDPRATDMVLSGNRAVIVGTGGEEYQVVNIRNESAPVRCGGFQDSNGIYDIATVMEPDNEAYAYVASGQTNAEFKIIRGGNGGQLSSSGTFESRTLPAAPTLPSNAAFNRFNVTFTQPATSTIDYQIAIKDQSAPGNCSGVTFTNADFFGPDGTVNTRYTNDAQVRLDNNGSGYENPGGCFRYRVYFTPSTDFLNSPIFNDITVNYTP